MSGLDLLESPQWSLGFVFKSDHPFFTINARTITHTWILLGLLTLLLLVVRFIILKKKSTARFIVLEFVRFFIDMCMQSMGTFFSFTHFSFITALFIFIFCGNILSTIPWLEEPTQDLNTTLALGVIAFLYTQIAAVRAQGIKAYIAGYFAPFFIMLPLNIVGKLASVVSISFRLFGNIFGSSIITRIYFSAIEGSLIAESAGLLTGLNIGMALFFSLFEGFLQAFVFAMLSLTYLSIALQGEGH
ncbi:MAG TPA: FoF1 ATP synthase subunit a [Candidatus Dependentiae bacterium]|nr:FoF1 ATP synthase subunit a [Candidatus Dependentiae bacterium]HRQ62721.1 FoF1 ATP synthase subunit a [Candidatus Dependentiae bacterium]